MNFKKEDVDQLNPEYIKTLPVERLQWLFERIRQDWQLFADQLNQNSTNSSIPPSQDKPWFRSSSENKNDVEDEDDASETDTSHAVDASPNESEDKEDTTSNSQAADLSSKNSSTSRQTKRKQGKQEGAQGYGRTQKLPIHGTQYHRPACCAGCGCAHDPEAPFKATSAHYTIDVDTPDPNNPGVRIIQIKHIYGSVICPQCGFKTTTQPYSSPEKEGWSVKISESRLIGPRLLALIVFLRYTLDCTMRKIRLFFEVWLGIEISEGCINTALREAGRSTECLEPEIIEDVKQSGILYVDETPWKERKKLRWVWLLRGTTAVYYTIGSRGKETVEKILANFSGWLMADGYCVYRTYGNRCRCWSHLDRKGKGLQESCNKIAAVFGSFVLDTLKKFRDAIRNMRTMNKEDRIPIQEHLQLEMFRFLLECFVHEEHAHKETAALATEFSLDFSAIFRPIYYPELPFTNNTAERELRSLVILRKICQGTKSPEGSRCIGLIYSVIATVTLRCQDVWAFFVELFTAVRKGAQTFALPAMLGPLPPPLPSPFEPPPNLPLPPVPENPFPLTHTRPPWPATVQS